MRIGVDVTCWANPRGYGRFTRELIPAMVAAAPEEQFLCLADRRAAEGFDLAAANVELFEVPLRQSPTTAAAAKSYRSPGDMLRLTRAVKRAAPDVFFCPSVYSYFPLPPGLRAVVTIHDTIAERFPSLTLPSWRARLFWKLKVSLALKQTRLVLTVSEFAAQEIRDVLGVAASRIRVAVGGPAAAFRPSPSRDLVAAAARRVDVPPEARWFTYVGGFNPHKRVDLLLRAHAQLVRRMPEDPPFLLLIGSRTSDVFHRTLGALDRLIQEEGTGNWVRWPGFVPDGELRLLHAGAVACVLPSECEGFGLPAVEAAACGTPVIATEASPLPALLEGGGLFVSAGDLQALTQAMETMLSDPTGQGSLGRIASERANALSWNEAARAAMAALHEAAA